MNRKEKAKEIVEEILEVEERELMPDTELADIEEWDSISKLALMAQVKHSGMGELSEETVETFHRVGDIYNFLENK